MGSLQARWHFVRDVRRKNAVPPCCKSREQTNLKDTQRINVAKPVFYGVEVDIMRAANCSVSATMNGRRYPYRSLKSVRKRTPWREMFKTDVIPAPYGFSPEEMRTPASVNTVPTISAEETALSNAILQRVNGLLAPDAAAQRERGRLFAVVHLGGKQYKVTQEDLVRVQQREFPADIGDRIRLEKVLLVGGSDFTLIGRPILSKDSAYVEATVIEKTFDHPRIVFRYRRRRHYKKLTIHQNSVAILRINKVDAKPLALQG